MEEARGRCCREWEAVWPPWETVCCFLRKLNRIPVLPALPVLGLRTPQMEAVRAHMFRVAKRWKQPQCALRDEWIQLGFKKK